jgi:hypothetical protein
MRLQVVKPGGDRRAYAPAQVRGHTFSVPALEEERHSIWKDREITSEKLSTAKK